MRYAAADEKPPPHQLRSVEPTFLCLAMIEIFDSGETARAGAMAPAQQPTAAQGVPDRRRGRGRYGAIGSSIAVAAPGWWYTRWVALR